MRAAEHGTETIGDGQNKTHATMSTGDGGGEDGTETIGDGDGRGQGGEDVVSVTGLDE